MDKILTVCGPTAVGKTSLGLSLAHRFAAEIVSADSRQVYLGMDIVTGKDLPPAAVPHQSSLVWRDRRLTYYLIDGIKVWLYDIITPTEPFNVSFWHECADLVITDILSRKKLPLIVGGSGLYLKSLTSSLSHISIPPDPGLRQKLSSLSAAALFAYLQQIDSERAGRLNHSDRANPRRLTRAIEIALHPESIVSPVGQSYDFLTLGLAAPLPLLYSRINQRVLSRLESGAAVEAIRLADQYDPRLPSFTACGYPALLGSDPVRAWQASERSYARRQLTWFKKQPAINWFDIDQPDWRAQADRMVSKWYN